MPTPILSRLPFSAAVFSLCLIGCDQLGTVDPPTDSGRITADRSATVETRPFKASYEFHVPGGPAVPCAGSVASRLFIEGEGNGTHLGRFTINLSQCDGPNGTLVDGRGTFVAANGDLLDFTYTGVLTGFVFPDLGFESQVTFTGGTGRFLTASGSAVARGSVDVTTGTGPTVWEGTISIAGRL
jgi:hypothetical protein